MILDIFMLWIIIGIILFVLGIELENIIYNMISLVIFIIIFAQSFWIEVPGIIDYTDNTTSAISLIFIFINLIWMIVQFLNLKKIKEYT